MSQERVLLNVIGHAGAGKSTMCHYLVETHGFSTYRPSDLLRMRAPIYGIELSSREDYVRCNQLLTAQDPYAIIRPVLESTDSRICIDGLRSPLNMSRLRERGAYIMALVGDPEVRYQHIRESERVGHRKPPTFEDFLADELSEYSTDPRLPNTQAIIDMADYVIEVDQSLDTIRLAADRVIAEIC